MRHVSLGCERARRGARGGAAHVGRGRTETESQKRGFGKTINTLLIIQTVLALVIIGCTYKSSTDAEYQAFVADIGMAEVASTERWRPHHRFFSSHTNHDI